MYFSGMAMSTTTLAGRLGAALCNLLIGLLQEKYCGIPLFGVTFVLLGKHFKKSFTFSF